MEDGKGEEMELDKWLDPPACTIVFIEPACATPFQTQSPSPLTTPRPDPIQPDHKPKQETHQTYLSCPTLILNTTERWSCIPTLLVCLLYFIQITAAVIRNRRRTFYSGWDEYLGRGGWMGKLNEWRGDLSTDWYGEVCNVSACVNCLQAAGLLYSSTTSIDVRLGGMWMWMWKQYGWWFIYFTYLLILSCLICLHIFNKVYIFQGSHFSSPCFLSSILHFSPSCFFQC